MHALYLNSPLYDASDIERVGSSPGKAGEHRDPFEMDRARIIHSFAFRRLQSKTQIFGLNESAFLRTRLTHSLEVANIGRALAAVINRRVWPDFPSGSIDPAYAALRGPVDTGLIEAACLAHDLGHPPFGHRGEETLNHCVWTRWPDHGNGFEGNGQTLRLLTNENLEVHAERHGLNLTRATLLAVVKYPCCFADVVNTDLYAGNDTCPPFRPWAPPKCILNEERPLLEWLTAPWTSSDREQFSRIERRASAHGRTAHRTLEAGIVELADDIAYGTHDTEDAFFAGLIRAEQIVAYLRRDDFESPARFDEFAALIRAMESGGDDVPRRERVFAKKGAASAVISTLISSAQLVEDPRFIHPRLRWRTVLAHDDRLALDALRAAVYDIVISGPAVQTLEYRGGLVLKRLFETFLASPELLSGKTRHLFDEADTEELRLRVLADYISGMTDEYAERLYDRLFQSESGSVFDRL